LIFIQYCKIRFNILNDKVKLRTDIQWIHHRQLWSTFNHRFMHYKVYFLVTSSYLQVPWIASENENNKKPIKKYMQVRILLTSRITLSVGRSWITSDLFFNLAEWDLWRSFCNRCFPFSTLPPPTGGNWTL